VAGGATEDSEVIYTYVPRRKENADYFEDRGAAFSAIKDID
jgi:hypothetical protein